MHHPAVAKAKKHANVDKVPGGAHEGTRVHLKMLHYYKSIFISKTVSIEERMERACCCTYFLGIWRDWLLKKHDYRGKHEFTLTENFITRQGHQDVERSSPLQGHQAVNAVILYCQVTRLWLKRHNNDGFGVHLERFGSDALGELFGKLATWDGSCRVCNALDVMRLITSMQRRHLHSSRGGKEVPKEPRCAANSDVWVNKWLKGEEAGDPYDQMAIPGWEDQDAMAKRALARVHEVFQRCGMAPIEDPAAVTPADKANHSWHHDPNFRDESHASLEKS